VWRAGGWSGMASRLPAELTHTWQYATNSTHNPMGVEVFGLIAGLGFVLSFGYWCTDFLVVQRAMAADSMSAARRTPLIAAFPKMFMPFVVIIPGIAPLALAKMGVGYAIPSKADGGPDYDQVLTTLMAQFYPSGMLGLGLTALMASFMSGMAGNVTAFNTVFTYDLYQGYIRKKAPDAHYLWVARITTVVGITLSVGTAYLATHFNNIMDFLQLVFGFVNAPLFATFCWDVLGSAPPGTVLSRGCQRHLRRRAHPRADARREQRRVDLRCSPVPIHNGTELLDRHLRLDHVLPGDYSGEPGDQSQSGIRAREPGLRPYENSLRGRSTLV
jgi:Na+/proline symporter